MESYKIEECLNLFFSKLLILAKLVFIKTLGTYTTLWKLFFRYYIIIIYYTEICSEIGIDLSKEIIFKCNTPSNCSILFKPSAFTSY